MIYNAFGGDDMFNKEHNFIPVKALKHHWTQPFFSYMETPRPDYGIMLVVNGQIDFVSSQKFTLSAMTGDIVFLPKNSYYEARFRIDLGDIDNYLINFESDMDLDCAVPVLLAENASFECIDLFREFVDKFHNAESMNLHSKGLFYLLLDSISNQKESSKAVSDKILNKAINLLRNNFDFSISQIAHECSVSESGLRKIFNDKIGISPSQFRLKEKFNKAKYLLESTNLSVSEISDKLNFYDSAYFCKLFRQHTHLTPKQYRQNKKL